MNVTLVNPDRVAVGVGIVRAYQLHDYIYSREVGVDNLEVFIIESLFNVHVLLGWKFFIRQWLCQAIIFEGASLYFQLQKQDFQF